MATLYRQYRPATFGEVVGQEHVTEALAAAVEHDKVTHAYLFQGPRGTGKTTTARLLANRLNCLKPKGAEPCNECESCRAMAEAKHTDVIEIDAASNRGIDDIRALRERISSAPTMGTYKVYIIDEVHMLTNEASTALLKTLEEPVKHVVFVLATTELQKVLPTILSRCQVFRFRRASDDEIKQRLTYLLKKEKRTAADEALLFIADRSDGCYRDAESLLGQLLTLQEGKLTVDGLVELLGLPPRDVLDTFLGALQRGESSPALAAVDAAVAAGTDPEQFLKESVRAARDAALEAVDDAAVNERWARIIRALLQALQDLAYVPQPMIAVHLAVISVCTKKGAVESRQRSEPARASSRPAAARPAEQVKDGAAPAKEEAAEASKSKQLSGAALADVEKAWPKLIETIKKENPVASTFLRAVRPIAVNGELVRVRAQYALHRTFFDNPKNKKAVAGALSSLIEQTVDIAVELDEGRAQGQPINERRADEENKLYETVKEVFG